MYYKSLLLNIFLFSLIFNLSLWAQGAWTTKSTMPTPRANPGTSVVNGKIYAIGGETAGGGCSSPVSSKIVQEYDPSTDTWTAKTPMSKARASLTTSAVNGKIYAIGGDAIQCSISLSTVEEYDPQTDTWSTKTNMPTIRTGLSSSVVNGKIYVIGGWSFSSGTALATVEVYDPATDTWFPGAPMNDSRAWFSTCAVDGKIYAFGGRSTTFKRKTVEVYDPATGIWTRLNDMPHVLGNYFVSTVNGLIYIFGGTWSNGGSPHSDSWEYNPLSDTWLSLSPMPANRSAGHASTVSGKIYLIGGSSTSWPWTPTSALFEYTPPVTGVEDPSRGEYNPEQFALHQNYPNPFNPETLIRYTIANQAPVMLKITNLLGQEVRTLVNEVKPPGIYEVKWDGNDNFGMRVNSGIYFYMIEAENFIASRKMIFIK